MNLLRRGGLALVFIALLLAGCGGGTVLPTPEFVGDWSAPGVNLSIAADGALAWRKVDEHGNSRSVAAPLRSFSPKQFSAGIGPFSTRFKVDQPPVRDGAVWRMTVDGVELIRPAEGPVSPQNEV